MSFNNKEQEILNEIKNNKPNNMSNYDYAVQLSKEKRDATLNHRIYKYTWSQIFHALNMGQYNMTESTLRKHMRRAVEEQSNDKNTNNNSTTNMDINDIDTNKSMDILLGKLRKESEKAEQKKMRSLIEQKKVNLAKKLLNKESDAISKIEYAKEDFIDTVAEHCDLSQYIDYQKDKYLYDKDDMSMNILLLSDFHYGMKSDVTRNKYDKEIFKQRMAELTVKTIEKLKIDKPKYLIVALLGDMINGDIHTTSRTFGNCDVVGGANQSQIVAEAIFSLLTNLAPYCKKIRVLAVCGNHDRTIADLKEATKSDSYYLTYYNAIRTQAINYNKMCGEEKIVCFNAHGDEIMSKTTEQLLLDDKNEWDKCICELPNKMIIGLCHGHYDKQKKVATNFQSILGSFGGKVDMVLMGHTHSVFEGEETGTKIIVNGSLCGTDEYADTKRLYNRPAQIMLHFDGTNWEDYTKYNIALTEGYEKEFKVNKII